MNKCLENCFYTTNKIHDDSDLLVEFLRSKIHQSFISFDKKFEIFQRRSSSHCSRFSEHLNSKGNTSSGKILNHQNLQMMETNTTTTGDTANKRLRSETPEEMQVDNVGTPVNGGYVPHVHQVNIPEPANPYKNLPEIDDSSDWVYSMRRTMQEIIPGLFLGPYAVATKDKLQFLKDVGITHILCVRHIREKAVIRPNFPNDFVYLVQDMADDSETLLIPFLKAAHRFIDDALNSGGKVLVHGNAGISRSTAIVIAYIMAVYGVSFKKAHRFVQAKRLTAAPSEWFVFQLKEYEVIYQAVHDTPHPLPEPGQPSTRPPLKRELIEDDDEDFNNN